MRKVLLVILGLVLLISLLLDRELVPEDIIAAIPMVGEKKEVIQTPFMENPIEYTRSLYRLKPDVRCHKALKQLVILGQSGAESPLYWGYNPDEEAWQAYLGEQRIGQVPEYPSLTDCIDLLTDYTQKNFSVRSAERMTSWQWSVNERQMLHDLQSLNNSFDQIRPETTYTIAHSLVNLVFLTYDTFEIADDLYATALAWLILAEVQTNQKYWEARVLLSSAFGYSEPAKQYATNLSEANIVRQFSFRQLDSLKEIAAFKTNDEFARYLVLELYANRKDFENWESWNDQYFDEDFGSLPMLRSALTQGAFINKRYYSELAPIMVMINMHPVLKAVTTNTEILVTEQVLRDQSDIYITAFLKRLVGSEEGDLLAYFEHELSEFDQGKTNQAIDLSHVLTQFYQAYFISGYQKWYEFWIDQKGSLEEAKDALDSINTREYKFSEHKVLAAWAKNRFLAQNADLSGYELQNFFDSNSGIAFLAKDTLFDDYLEYNNFEHYSYEPRSLLRSLARQMDSRPSHALEMSRKAYNLLYDLHLAENLYQHIDQNNFESNMSMVAWLLHLRRDTQGLMQLLDKESITTKTMKAILANLEKHNLGTKIMQELYEKAIDRYPSNQGLSYAYYEYLKIKGQYKKARKVIQNWFNQNPADGGLDRVMMNLALGRTYYFEDDLESAWQIAELIAPSYQRGALSLSADVLEAMGKLEESQAFYLKITERYRAELTTHLDYAEFLWRNGMYEAVPQVIQQWSGELSGKVWHSEIAPRFFKVFKDKNAKETQQAYSRLFDVFPFLDLMYLSYPFMKSDKRVHKAIGLDILKQIQLASMDGVQINVLIYKTLSELESPEKALAWFKKAVPSYGHPVMMIMYFDQNVPSLLWDAMEPMDDENGEWLWVFRAAAATYYNYGNPEQIQELKKYFKRSKGFTHNLGRVVLGLESVEDVQEQVGSDRQEAELAFMAGLHYTCLGQMYEASDWLRAISENGPLQMGETRIAINVLYNMRKIGRTLEYVIPDCSKSPVLH